MRRKLGSQAGMSLVEATIILMVLAVLTSVIAPSMGDYIEDARNTKAKEDVEAIGTAVLRLVRDTGIPCLTTVSTPTIATACTKAGRADILLSSGTASTVVATAVALPAGTIGQTIGSTGSVNWSGSTATVGTDTTLGTNDDLNAPLTQTTTIDAQFVTNGPSYTAVSFSSGGGPKSGLGWRGAYLTGPTGADPWGFTYQANTVFLTTASNAAGSTEGLASSGWQRDVIVVSGGSNGAIQTSLGANPSGSEGVGTTAVGDDVIYTVQGASR